MSLYGIIDRCQQDITSPAYRLRHCRERLARHNNHLTFLTRCRNEGVIPNGLKVSLPVKSTKADLIAHKTSKALLRERISEAHRQKLVASHHISELEKELSQMVPEDRWSSLDQHCRAAANCMNKTMKERQMAQFNCIQSRKVNSQHTLDSSKLVVNLSTRQLSPLEDVLALGLSFAVAPRQVPVQEIVAATEALAHSLDGTSADLQRLKS